MAKRQINAQGRPKADPLAAPEGGWPARPLWTTADRMPVAEWLWSQPHPDAERYDFDGPHTVERLIYGLSCNLIDDLNNRESLPTKKEHLDRLRDLVKTASKLQAQLEYFSGDRGILRIVALQSAFFRYAAYSKLIDCKLIDWDEVLGTPLGALILLATDEIEDIATAAPGPGHQRLHDRLFGDPRYTFAFRAAQLLQTFCGESAIKVTENGTLHRLMNSIWAGSTGLDPENYNLFAFLKKGVSFWRTGESRRPNLLFMTVLNRSKKRRLQP